MDSLTKEQAFDTIYTSFRRCCIYAARSAFNITLTSVRADAINKCIALARNNGAAHLIDELVKMKSEEVGQIYGDKFI